MGVPTVERARCGLCCSPARVRWASYGWWHLRQVERKRWGAHSPAETNSFYRLADARTARPRTPRSMHRSTAPQCARTRPHTHTQPHRHRLARRRTHARTRGALVMHAHAELWRRAFALTRAAHRDKLTSAHSRRDAARRCAAVPVTCAALLLTQYGAERSIRRGWAFRRETNGLFLPAALLQVAPVAALVLRGVPQSTTQRVC